MNDAKRYQRDYDLMIQETEERAVRIRQDCNHRTVRDLLTAAYDVGISANEAIDRIESHPGDLKTGAMSLIEEARIRRFARAQI